MSILRVHEAEGQIDAGPHLAPARDCTWAARQPLSPYPPALLSQEKPPLASVTSKTSEDTGRYRFSHPLLLTINQSVSELREGELVLLNSGQKGKKVRIFHSPILEVKSKALPI